MSLSVKTKRIFLSPPHMGVDEMVFIRKAFESNYIAPLGPMVDAFEKEFAEYVDIKHCVALTSGTAAMHLALRHLGVGPGDLPDPESEGAQHLRQYCTACHALPGPQTHSATDWPVVLRRMWMRIDGLDPKYAVPIPTAGERVVLMRYLLDNALQVSRAELPSGQGRQLYMTECSRCHELPDPRQHTASDWPAVVIRMREHSVQMLRRSPPQSQVQEIILYLERASRAGT